MYPGKGNSVKRLTQVGLTVQLSVKQSQPLQPPDALRFELGQLGFGFLRFDVVLLALGFQLLIIQGALLEGILSSIKLLIRLGLLQEGTFKLVFQQLLELGAPIDVILEPLDLGCVLLLSLIGLGLSVRELVFQLQVLKNEQLEELATLVVRFLQKATRAMLKRSRGLAPEFRITEEIRKCKKRLGDYPSLQ